MAVSLGKPITLPPASPEEVAYLEDLVEKLKVTETDLKRPIQNNKRRHLR